MNAQSYELLFLEKIIISIISIIKQFNIFTGIRWPSSFQIIHWNSKMAELSPLLTAKLKACGQDHLEVK